MKTLLVLLHQPLGSFATVEQISAAEIRVNVQASKSFTEHQSFRFAVSMAMVKTKPAARPPDATFTVTKLTLRISENCIYHLLSDLDRESIYTSVYLHVNLRWIFLFSPHFGETSRRQQGCLEIFDAPCSPVELGEDVDGRRVVSAARPEHLQVDGGRSVQVGPFAPALFALDPPERLLVLDLPLRLPALRVGVRHSSEKLEDSPVGRKVTASRRKNSSSEKQL